MHLVQESKVETVDVRMVPIQQKQEIALKELLQFVRCHCKTECATKHSSCRKMGMDARQHEDPALTHKVPIENNLGRKR